MLSGLAVPIVLLERRANVLRLSWVCLLGDLTVGKEKSIKVESARAEDLRSRS